MHDINAKPVIKKLEKLKLEEKLKERIETKLLLLLLLLSLYL